MPRRQPQAVRPQPVTSGRPATLRLEHRGAKDPGGHVSRSIRSRSTTRGRMSRSTPARFTRRRRYSAVSSGGDLQSHAGQRGDQGRESTVGASAPPISSEARHPLSLCDCSPRAFRSRTSASFFSSSVGVGHLGEDLGALEQQARRSVSDVVEEDGVGALDHERARSPPCGVRNWLHASSERERSQVPLPCARLPWWAVTPLGCFAVRG